MTRIKLCFTTLLAVCIFHPRTSQLSSPITTLRSFARLVIFPSSIVQLNLAKLILYLVEPRLMLSDRTLPKISQTGADIGGL